MDEYDFLVMVFPQDGPPHLEVIITVWVGGEEVYRKVVDADDLTQVFALSRVAWLSWCALHVPPSLLTNQPSEPDQYKGPVDNQMGLPF